MSNVVNRRATLTGVGAFTLADEAMAELAAEHVRLGVEAVGICGSDLHTYRGENPVIRIPIAPGHEFAGRVVDVGDGVSASLIGSRVAARPSVPCRTCGPCTSGDEHLCDRLKFVGSFVYDGAFGTYVDLPAECVIVAPEGISAETLVFAEPLACALHALSVAGELGGREVLVVGCGTIGQLVAIAARLAGARVHVTDLVGAKVALAAGFGAIPATATATAEDGFRRADGGRFDVVFDCVGKASTIDASFRSARKGGTVTLVGVPTGPVPIDPVRVLVEERRFVGSFICRDADFVRAVELLVSGAVDPAPLISGRFPLAQIGEAFVAATSDLSLVKLVLHP